jgi:prohibitin 2
VYTVGGYERAIVWDRVFGVSSEVKSTGMHFRFPFFQYPILYDVRVKPRNVQTLTGSKDLQMVQITLRVMTKPDERRLPAIYRDLGQDYDDRVLPSIVNEISKAIVAKYNASELITRRAEVSREIQDALIERARNFNIIMSDVSITHLEFSPVYARAVESKQVAQQESQRARYIVDKALQEKKSIVIKAQGEAESAKLIGNAVKKDPAFIELRRIEAAKEIAEVVNKSQNKLFLSTDSLMLNIMDSDNDLTKKVGFFFTVVRCFLIFLLLHVAFGSFFLVLFHGP